MTGANHGRMISTMRLAATLAWLVDAASAMPTADSFLAGLAERLMADGVPLSGGALTLTTPHPIIARRAWLWQAETGAVIEALDFGSIAPIGPERGKVGRDWLLELCAAAAQGSVVASAPDDQAPIGPASDRPLLDWAVSRPLADAESVLLHQVGRFSAGPLTAIGTRTTLAALLETYLGRRSAAQVLAGRLRRESGETIRAVLLYGDLRGFTALSEAMPPEEVVAALDAWFDRVAGAVHAFGGEVLKFIGDGVLAIFRSGNNHPLHPAMPLCARSARPGPAWLTSTRLAAAEACRSSPSGSPCISVKCSGATSAPPTGWISPRSALQSTWSTVSKDCVSPWAAMCWSRVQSRRKRALH